MSGASGKSFSVSTSRLHPFTKSSETDLDLATASTDMVISIHLMAKSISKTISDDLYSNGFGKASAERSGEAVRPCFIIEFHFPSY